MSTSIFSSLGTWLQETTWKTEAAFGSSDAQSHLNALAAVNNPSTSNEQALLGTLNQDNQADISAGLAASEGIAATVNAENILPPGPASWWNGIKNWWATWKAKYGTTVMIIIVVVVIGIFIWLIRPMLKRAK